MIKFKAGIAKKNFSLLTIVVFFTVILFSSNSNMGFGQAISDCAPNVVVSVLEEGGNVGDADPLDAIDNNLDTRWSREGKGSSLTLDLGSYKQICSVDMAFYKGNARIYYFDMFASEDGENFSQIFTGQSSGMSLSQERFDVSANGRFLKIVFNGNNQNNWGHITEVDINTKEITSDPDSECTKQNIQSLVSTPFESHTPPINAIDNNLNTRWSSFGKGSFITLDLGSTKQLCEIDIAWYKGNERINTFTISSSEDGSNFEEIFSGKSSGKTTAPERYSLEGTGRYVRITVNGNNENNWASITEVSVFGKDDDSGGGNTCLKSNIASIKAKGHEGENTPQNVLDSNIGTRWSNLGKGSFITLDLGSTKQLCNVNIAWYRGDTRINDFTIGISSDGNSFNQIFSGKSSGESLSSEKYDVLGTGRYVRITVNGNNENNWASITEVSVFGKDAGTDNNQGKLIVIKKVINDHGGTLNPSDFTLHVEGQNASPSSFTGKANPGTEVLMDAGEYTIGEEYGEDMVSKYSVTFSSECSGIINAGETKTCTVTNNDIAQNENPIKGKLIVIKKVINDHGGTLNPSDFTLHVEGQNVSSSSFKGADMPGTEILMDAGQYKVGETEKPLYQSVFSPECSGTINAGETKTCTVTNNDIAPNTGDSTDVFGVKKIYPTAPGGEEWYMNMQNPTSDKRFDPKTTITKNSDGSWKVKDGKVRMNVFTSSGYQPDKIVYDHSVLATRGYMQDSRDWKNIEMTGYVKLNSYDGDDDFNWYARGGRHSDHGWPGGCEGSAYKPGLFFSGDTRFAKEQWHVSYDFTPKKKSTGSIEGKWVGFKAVMYNIVIEGKTAVKLEIWLDVNNNNDWKKVNEYIDKGGLGSEGEECKGKPDQIITWGGPVATYRVDSTEDFDFKNLSVREIVAGP